MPMGLEEYVERCWDIYWGRAGNDNLQAATPIHLRAGCRGVVYDSVRAITHAELSTWNTTDPDGSVPIPAGMERFIAAVKGALDVEEEREEVDGRTPADACVAIDRRIRRIIFD